MKEYQGMPGETIEKAAEELVARANLYQEPVKTDFNTVQLVVKPGGKPKEVVMFYKEERKLRRRLHKQSAEYKRIKLEDKIEKQKHQQQADELMQKLDELDFEDVGSLIDWLVALQPHSNYTGIKVDSEKLIGTFRAHGFCPKAYVGNKHVENDREIYARWIIGQALSTLEICAIHDMVVVFAERWYEKFTLADSSC